MRRERRVGHDRRGQRGEVLRVHRGDELARWRGRALRARSRPADAEQGDHADLHARRVRLARGLDVIRRSRALGDALEGRVVARLGADVEERQAERAQLVELGGGLLEDVARHRVARHLAQLREAGARGAQDRPPVIHRQHQRVAVGDEDLVDRVARDARGFAQVLQRLGEVAHAELLAAVHVAVHALVPRAADGRLQDVAVRLRRRAIERRHVAHRGKG